MTADRYIARSPAELEEKLGALFAEFEHERLLERALWHLELLGCYCPEDAIAPAEAVTPPREWNEDDWDDECACTRCGGEGWGEVDDPLWDECDEFGYGPCCACHGTGERRHQWIF